MITRDQLQELFQIDPSAMTALPLLERLTDMQYDLWETQYQNIFDVSDGTGTGQQDFAVGDFPMFRLNDSELGNVSLAEQGKWFPKTYIYSEYNLGYVVSHNTIADDKWNLAGQRAKAFGRSAKVTPEVIAISVFNNGFTAAFTGPDGKVLFATDHPNPGPAGGTQSNRPTSGTDLSHASLEAGVIATNSVTNDQGFPINIPMKNLLVPGALEFRAKEITSGPWRSDTANRVQYVLPSSIEPQVNRYLTAARAWFLTADNRMTGLRFIWRERFNRKQWMTDSNRSYNVGGWMRLATGWSFWFGTYGNPGLGG
jgi:phage major head subunit gpT-like protein